LDFVRQLWQKVLTGHRLPLMAKKVIFL